MILNFCYFILLLLLNYFNYLNFWIACLLFILFLVLIYLVVYLFIVITVLMNCANQTWFLFYRGLFSLPAQQVLQLALAPVSDITCTLSDILRLLIKLIYISSTFQSLSGTVLAVDHSGGLSGYDIRQPSAVMLFVFLFFFVFVSTLLF